ncbi:MAG: hypothetical protein JWO82_1881 [Akkermansiaceae bacterium]|nr:hypothetical protein [Akkermansiaceae bacterium]
MIRPNSIWCLLWAFGSLFLAGTGHAEEEWRTWKSSAGTFIEAKLVSFDGKQAKLEKKDGKFLTVPATALSPEDQEVLAKSLIAPVVKGDPFISGIAAKPGVISAPIVCEADKTWSYLLYLPKDFHSGRKWPVCFVMDPGGMKASGLEHYIPAAERLGVILAGSVESRNDFSDSEVAMMAMVKDVNARVPVLPKFAMTSGMSGGARMAYLMAEYEPTVSGVLSIACGAGVYVKDGGFRQPALRKSTAVVTLIGTNDYSRTEAVQAHNGFGKDAPILWFEGHHDWASKELIGEGMAVLYGKILERCKDKSFDFLKEDFAKDQLTVARENKDKQPEVTYRWATFLSKFPSGVAATQKEADALNSALTQGPQIAKGEKAMETFTKKYFSEGYHATDCVPNPGRDHEAGKVSAEVAGSPAASLIKLMGAECDKP